MTIAEPRKRRVGIQDPVFCKSIRYYFREYCHCSSIHGFRYFGEKRTYFERIWWFIVFGIVVVICIYFIANVYEKWNSSPVIVSFDTRETKIHSIPFPAVTICPEVKSRRNLYNHTDVYLKLQNGGAEGMDNLTNTETVRSVAFTILIRVRVKIREKIKLSTNSVTVLTFVIIFNTKSLTNVVCFIFRKDGSLYMSMICDVRRKVKSQSPTFSEDIFQFLDNVRRRKTLYACSWMGEKFSCHHIFSPIFTDEGICYAFNMLDREDIFRSNVIHYKNFGEHPERENLTWNLDEGYLDEKVNTYPKRAKFPGVKSALSVTLMAFKDDLDPTCKDSIQGFKVILHTPMRLPRASNQYFRVPLDEAVLGSIQPAMISTSYNVKTYDPERRQCFFPSERYLRFFKIYTQLNCDIECLTNFTSERCGCVKFFMPRENGTNICGASKENCMDEAEKALQIGGLIKSMNEIKRKKKSKPSNIKETMEMEAKAEDIFKMPNCNCLPLCSDLSYSVEISQAKWDWQNKPDIMLSKLPSKNKVKMSKLMLYFKTSQFVTSKRHELYGPTDFLANFGGLLGLFTGLSALSIIEIIYFLSIRLFCNVRLYGRWYGPES
ncbi:pickpocket protein 28-like [Euwallacea similis]|uniref:pickpocket protein 28-like n=1 Tax=Euwallacea similis TaxID=1736056 RepID=UPI0034505850